MDKSSILLLKSSKLFISSVIEDAILEKKFITVKESVERNHYKLLFINISVVRSSIGEVIESIRLVLYISFLQHGIYF